MFIKMNLLAKLKREFINVDHDEAIDDREPFGTTGEMMQCPYLVTFI